MELIFLSDIAVPPAQFLQYLLWSIGILVAAIGSVVGMYLRAQSDLKKVYEAQLKQKDEQLAKEIEKTEAERKEKIKILYEIKPALHAVAEIGKETLEFIRS